MSLFRALYVKARLIPGPCSLSASGCRIDIELITEIMEDAVQLEVPNKIDYEEGSNWGDIK